MKRKPLLLLSLFLLSILACRKEPEPDIPCDDFIGFTCLINGERFNTDGNLRCSGTTRWYNTATMQLVIAGTDCNVNFEEPFLVNFTIFKLNGTGSYTPPLMKSNYTYMGDSNLTDYDSTLSGSVVITGFTEDNYSADFTNGYVEGRFEFTQYNEQLKDTAYITNGLFCMRL